MSKHQELVLTAVGPDRPGLVSDVTGLLLAAGANVADSRMVNLRGQFALLVLVEGSEPVLARVRTSLDAEAPKLGLRVTIDAERRSDAATGGIPYRLRTYSSDQPGIVHRISELLRRRNINIESLSTSLSAAPFAGTSVFTLDLLMSVPPDVALHGLRDELGRVAAQLNCDFDLEPVRA